MLHSQKMTETIQLAQAYKELTTVQPHIGIRKAAEQLGVSELTLLKLDEHSKVILLKNRFKPLLRELADLGKVIVWIQGESSPQQYEGIYQRVRFKRGSRRVEVKAVAMTLKFSIEDWRSVYAVRSIDGKQDIFHALHFYDKAGKMVQQIILTSYSNPFKFNEIIEKYRV